MAIQLLVILVPVLFGFMGFAIDLGRLYLVRGELNQAANAMALSAAQQLIGTSAATGNATISARLTLDNSNLDGNKYNFGSLTIGDSGGFYASDVPDPSYYSAAADAMNAGNSNASTADGTTAQYVQANITADAPLTFWSFLSAGASRKTSIAARAVAGISAPLCVGCGIQNFAIAAVDATDTVNFGISVATRYTFGYQCTGNPQPQALANTTTRLPYLLLDRYNTSTSLFDESQQLFQIGAGGLPGSTVATQSCFTVNTGEVIWATAAPQTCNSNSVAQSVRNLLCGVTTRFTSATPTTCEANVTDIDNLTTAYNPDTDLTDLDDYTAYVGSLRRVITVPIVDALSATGSMTVLGFRQFLVEATSGETSNDPTDADGRFQALYIGSPVPLKQGRFDGGCAASSGPGKVVLFQ